MEKRKDPRHHPVDEEWLEYQEKHYDEDVDADGLLDLKNKFYKEKNNKK